MYRQRVWLVTLLNIHEPLPGVLLVGKHVIRIHQSTMDLQGEGSIILTDQWIWTKKPHSTKFVYVHTPLSIMNKPWQFGMDVMRSILHGKWENNQKLEIDVLTFCQTQSSEASHILNIMTWTFWIYLSPYLKWFLRVHSHVHVPDLNRPFQMLHLFASSLYPHFVGILSVCLNTKCPCRTPPQSLRTRQQHPRSLASIDLYLFRLLRCIGRSRDRKSVV